MEDLAAVQPKETLFNLARTISLGTGILSFILISHWSEAYEIISDMKVNSPANLPEFSIFISLLFLLLGFQKKNLHPFLNTFLALVIGYFLPLIPAFICYFSCCHAIYSLEGMKNHLETSFLNLYKKLAPFSIGAIFLCFAYLLWLFGGIWGWHLLYLHRFTQAGLYLVSQFLYILKSFCYPGSKSPSI
jgi:hypothetical protein